ncbi:NnrU family protein [Myxococcota bacterium]|nr:NnrU family protein [Myxococcota bacterium]
MDAVDQVLLGWLAFGGTHTALSHPPLRDRLVAKLGDRGFLLVYSLVAFATFVPLVRAFFTQRVPGAVPLPVLATVPGIWWLTMAMMFVALNLIVIGFMRPNPVSALMAGIGGGGGAGVVVDSAVGGTAMTGRASGRRGHDGAGSTARGALRITRHPAFMGVALAGFAHLLVNPAPIDRAFFGGMVVYSILGCAHQDWRRRRAGGPALEGFFAETSFLPFVAIAEGRNRLVVGELPKLGLVASAALFGLLFVTHHRIFG